MYEMFERRKRRAIFHKVITPAAVAHIDDIICDVGRDCSIKGSHPYQELKRTWSPNV
jgi:hypothetical protein